MEVTPSSDPWPNLFIVGVARGGTSSLWHWLGQHPDIYMSRLKEPYFFSRTEMYLDPFPKETDAYLELFIDAGDARWRGEASTAYFWDDVCPARIRDVSPDARIVISLRDPVARAYSGYWFAVRHGGESRRFLDVVRSELEAAPDKSAEAAPGHTSAGYYVDHLKRYAEIFGDRVHVLLFDDLVEDPRRESRKIFEFLEVDPTVADKIDFVALNASVAPRNAIIRRLLGVSAVRSFARVITPQAFQPRTDRLARSGHVPELDPEARQLLTSIYAPEREELESILGRALPWPR